jgi:hypothetical protein
MKYLLTIMMLGFLTTSFAQKYSNEFLSIGVGAAAQSMGNAQVASVSDATSGFWNPAGLANIKSDMQVSFMHAEWFASIGNYDYLSIAKPISDGKRTLGLSIIRFGIDNIPNTLSLYESDGTINYDNIKPFSAVDYAFLFSYAQKLKSDKLSIGGSAKVIHRTIGPFATSWGFGFDLGLQYHVTDNFTIGLLGKDITTTFNAWDINFTEEEKEVLEVTGNDIIINSVEITRPSIILGFAYQQRFDKVGLLAEVNANLTTDGERNVLVSANPISMDPVAGIQLDYNERVYLRGGVNTIQKEIDLTGTEFWSVNPNIGIGVKLGTLRLDYAFTNVGEQSNNTYSHIVSLVLDVDYNYWKKVMKN